VTPDTVTPELCLVAVRQNGGALRFVPQAMRTPEIYAAAVDSCAGLWQVPAPERTAAMCAVAVERDGDELQFVLPGLRTPALILAAVSKRGRALRHVASQK
jgi:hypothetical protein